MSVGVGEPQSKNLHIVPPAPFSQIVLDRATERGRDPILIALDNRTPYPFYPDRPTLVASAADSEKLCTAPGD